MADSDDEYNDGRRRDKFVRERNDYSSSNRGNSNLGGGWQSNDNYPSTYRAHQQQHRTDSYGRNQRYNNQPSNYNSSNYDHPPLKRGRIALNNWNENRYSHSNYESNYDNSSYVNSNDNTLTQPPMLSFKQYMRGLDDSIDHVEAAKKYNEYKNEFKRKQIVEFFTTHKDEEWFRIKYHPIESAKRKKELKGYCKHRAEVFFDLHTKGLISTTSIDIEKSDQMTNVLDSIVIKLEGGTDYDLKCLEAPAVTDKTTATTFSENETCKTTEQVDKMEEDKIDDNVEEDGEVASTHEDSINADISSKKDDAEQQKQSMACDETANKDEQENGEIQDEEDEQSNSDIKQENKGELTLNKEYDEYVEKNPSLDTTTNEDDEQTTDNSLNVTVIEQKSKVDEELKDDKVVDANQNIIEDKLLNVNQEEMECKDEETKVESTELNEKVENQVTSISNDPRPLHRTLSIFLRYLPANVTKNEIEQMFKTYPGFLRVALADPTFDKRFQRRGWITFDRNVDIKKVYLSMNSVRIRDCEIGAIINRDLSRRIRSVNGIASHRLNVLADLKHTTKIILNLDEEKGIWEQNNSNNQIDNDLEHNYKIEGLSEPITVFDQKTRNPLLVGIEDCFKEKQTSNESNEDAVDETGEIKEEESDNDDLEPKPLERDEELIKVLDNLVFYLRIVHSLDYYNHIDYPNEDEMPNRIGIMHARGMLPTANVTLKEVKDYIRKFETNISPYLERVLPLNDDEVEKLGKRKVADEIEKFINENTKELGPEKWLCPISGKKFKGPEFVRKHIETKQQDKLEEVKHETEFFNLYLADSRRPQLAEHQFNKPIQNKQSSSTDNPTNSYGNSGNIHQRINFNQGGYNGNSGNRYNSGYNNYNNNNYNNYNRTGNRFNRKRLYRDLDAPSDDF